MRRLLLFCFAFWTVQLTLFAQDAQKIQQSIKSFTKDVDLKHTNIGIHVVKMKTGEVLGTHEAEESMATASVLKTLTTATALLQNGADFCYQTPVNYTGKIVGGKLQGDLVIKGVGDPTFNSKYFPQNDAVAKVVALVKQKGITQILGEIVVDNSLFESTVPPMWTWEDVGNYYGAGLHTINFQDNLYKLTFQTVGAGTRAKVVGVSPKQNLKVQSEVFASKIKADRAYILGSPFSRERVVRGTLPENRKRFTIKGAMSFPELAFDEAVKSALQQQGISVLGSVKLEKCKKTMQKIGVIQSPILQEIIKVTNHESVNLFAEAMLYLIKTKEKTNRENLLNAEKAFWKDKGLNTSGLFLHDGSGLSHFNAVNPSFFTQMLRMVARSCQGKSFKATLPISGKTGTLQYLGKGTALAGKVHGKSGSMKQVYCYVGYLTTKSGEEVTFAVMLNNFDMPSYKIRQKIAELLMQW